MSKIQMNPEMIEALKAAGIEVAPAKVELTTEQKVARGVELLALRAELLAMDTDESKKALKKVRRQLRNECGIYLSILKKAVTE